MRWSLRDGLCQAYARLRRCSQGLQAATQAATKPTGQPASQQAHKPASQGKPLYVTDHITYSYHISASTLLDDGLEHYIQRVEGVAYDSVPVFELHAKPKDSIDCRPECLSLRTAVEPTYEVLPYVQGCSNSSVQLYDLTLQLYV